MPVSELGFKVQVEIEARFEPLLLLVLARMRTQAGTGPLIETGFASNTFNKCGAMLCAQVNADR